MTNWIIISASDSISPIIIRGTVLMSLVKEGVSCVAVMPSEDEMLKGVSHVNWTLIVDKICT